MPIRPDWWYEVDGKYGKCGIETITSKAQHIHEGVTGCSDMLECEEGVNTFFDYLAQLRWAVRFWVPSIGTYKVYDDAVKNLCYTAIAESRDREDSLIKATYVVNGSTTLPTSFCFLCGRELKSGQLIRCSSEFDCELHDDCLQTALKLPYDMEVKILANEFGLPYTAKKGE